MAAGFRNSGSVSQSASQNVERTPVLRGLMNSGCVERRVGCATVERRLLRRPPPKLLPGGASPLGSLELGSNREARVGRNPYCAVRTRGARRAAGYARRAPLR